MQVGRDLLDSLALKDAASTMCTGGGNMQRFPPLALHHCLANDLDGVGTSTRSAFVSGRTIASEVLTVPRRGFGVRPAQMLAVQDRILYHAMVDKIADAAGIEASRSAEKWNTFQSFGIHPSTKNYIVDVDIASCYEYINHELLAKELLLKCDETALVETLVSFLGEINRSPVGLPQLSNASDLLAEAYLERIERDLLRAGHDVLRIADDFKIATDDWGSALEIIELAAESARRVGLVLSTEKTRVTKKSTVLARREELISFLMKYFERADEELRTESFIVRDYEEVEVVVNEPDEDEKARASYRHILEDWMTDPGGSTHHAQALLPALSTLVNADYRIDDEILVEIVFHHPLYLENVCMYVRARDKNFQDHDNWATLCKLTEISRQSAWAKIWMLFLSGRLIQGWSPKQQEVRAWVLRQTVDRHESVRGQAAWALSILGGLTADLVARLYSDASDISRPVLAAAAGRAGFEKKNGTVQALNGDGKLARSAYEWGVWRIENE